MLTKLPGSIEGAFSVITNLRMDIFEALLERENVKTWMVILMRLSLMRRRCTIQIYYRVQSQQLPFLLQII